jgi:F0F1-type ATP synthase epsilon subunit
VVLPAFDGEWGVLANHAPMVAELAVGCLRLGKPDGTGALFAVRGGFAEVRDNTVTVLSPDCRGPDELTTEMIEAELGKAGGAPGEPDDQARRQAWAKACRAVLGGGKDRDEA